MSRKKKKPVSCGVITAQQQFDANKPKYNAWVCRGGVHGDTSYNRRRAKTELRRIINEA